MIRIYVTGYHPLIRAIIHFSDFKVIKNSSKNTRYEIYSYFSFLKFRDSELMHKNITYIIIKYTREKGTGNTIKIKKNTKLRSLCHFINRINGFKRVELKDVSH